MLYLDLKWVLLTGFLAVFGLPSLFLWLNNRQGAREKEVESPNPISDILSQAPLGTLTLQHENHFRYANPYAQQLLHLDDSTGSLPDEDWAAALLEDRQAARQGESQAARYRLISLPYNQFGQWWVFPGDDGDVVFLLDVTTQQQLRQNNQLLFSGFSHELRTPIATIATHLEVLNVPNLPVDVKTQSHHILKEEARRMTKLVEHMVDLGRLEATETMERRPLQLAALVEDTVAQLRPIATKKELTLTLEAETPLPTILGDAYRLKQVWLNVLDNAIKYTPADGEITVSLTQIKQEIHCSVADNGPGIPREHLPYVTQHFYRVDKQAYEGSGLGLAIANQILQSHQSKLHLESIATGANTGTRVSFTLPIMAVGGAL